MSALQEAARVGLALAIVCSTVLDADARRRKGNNRSGPEPTTCSEKRHQIITKVCVRTDLSMSSAKCKSDVEARHRKCLATGIWSGRKQTLRLAKR